MVGEQRRLAAILAADVVGYSRLMGRDEGGTVARLRELRKQHFEPALARHNGRLVKLTGDGALVEFPSAVGALAAAIEFQQAMAEVNREQPGDSAIVFRIGVHLGDLIVEGDDLYGDGVNVAARLEAEAPAGGIVISGNVHDAVGGRLKARFHDLGDLRLKNIERAVRAHKVAWDAADWPATTGGDAPSTSPIERVHSAELTLPEKPSIAVLPFTNMGGDPEQEFFTDGITEDIITELSRFHSLFVIARNSTFTYKGRAVDVRTVARELGVRYVLEGSIRRAGNRIRVLGQLIDSVTGNHIWAERYDRVLEDVFEVQEEVTRAIVAAIAPQIEGAEIAKSLRVRPRDLGAYELALRAWADVRDAFTKSDPALRDRAIDTARKALAGDAECSLALMTICNAQWQHILYHTAADVEAAGVAGIAAGTRAIEIDPSNHLAFAVRGLLNYQTGQRRAGLDDLRYAHSQNPNDALTLFSLGYAEAAFGDATKGIEYGTMALRLSPRDYWRATMQQILALSYFLARRYEEGKQAALAAARERTGQAPAYTALALNLVGLDEVDKAMAAVETARRIAPAYLDARLAGGYDFNQPADLERATVFLRIAAGLEDPSAAEPLR